MLSKSNTNTVIHQKKLTKPAILYKQWKLAGNPAYFFDELTSKFGDFIYYRGIFNFYFVNHPDLVKQVLKDTNVFFDKNTLLYDRFRNVFGEGLVTAEGKAWENQRQLIQPIFSPKAVKSFFDIMLSSTVKTADRWQTLAESNSIFDVATQMNQLTLEIAGRTLFNDDFNNISEKISHWTHTINHYSGQPPLPLLSETWFPSPTNLKLNKVMREFHKFIADMISQRRNSSRPTDLLTTLMNTSNKDGTKMPDLQIEKEVLGMIIGGHETSSNALTWAWYELHKNPAIEKKLHNELQSVLGNRLPTLDDIPKLKYTRMIIDEATRLHPPFWFENRNTMKDIDMWGHKIPKGSTVAFSRYSLHRNPNIWENPEVFNPERFDTTNPINKRSHYAHVPFGGGPRICVGINFALLELVVILATLSQRFRLKTHHSHRNTMQALLTMEPKFGLPVTAELRK